MTGLLAAMRAMVEEDIRDFQTSHDRRGLLPAGLDLRVAA